MNKKRTIRRNLKIYFHLLFLAWNFLDDAKNWKALHISFAIVALKSYPKNLHLLIMASITFLLFHSELGIHYFLIKFPTVLYFFPKKV